MKLCCKAAAAILGIIVCCFGELQAFAYTDMQSERNYTYNQNGDAVYIPNAYEYAGAVSLADLAGTKAKNPQDLYIDQDRNQYVADTDNNRILILDKNNQFQNAISEIKATDGTVSSLNRPQGIYVYPNGELLIADTQNHRIVRCDRAGNAKKIIEKPADMTGIEEGTDFLPSKVACDSAGRINVIATNINFGIVQLDSEGIFLSYIGAPKVQPDLFTLFWRKFSTETQKKRMVDFIATEYSNLYIDDADMIWGTISTLDIEAMANAIQSRDKSGSVTPIRVLNAMGNDILMRNGQFAPMGDLSIVDAENEQITPSQIIDVAVGPGGIYSLLDKARGHIFTYDTNGNLLYVFGNYGMRKSDLLQPSAITYIGDTIAVLDAGLGKIQLYRPTSYGKMVVEAVTQQYEGNFDAANALWIEIAGQNTNFAYAFVGLGNAQQSRKEYAAALDSYRFANDPESYSNAFILQRQQTLNIYFPIIFGVLLGIVVLLILSALFKKFWRYYKGK